MFNIVNLLSANILQYVLIPVVIIFIIVMIVMPMFTNRKRQKEANEMLDAISVGDEIMTIGGIMGKVVELKTHESGEKLMVIETGDGNTMTFTVQALRLNYTKAKLRQEQLERQRAEREAAKAAKNEQKANKSESTEDAAKSEDADKSEPAVAEEAAESKSEANTEQEVIEPKEDEKN